MEGFLRYEFGGRGIYLEGPIHEGAYFRNFTALQLCVRYNTVCIFYGTCLQSTRFKKILKAVFCWKSRAFKSKNKAWIRLP